MNEELQVALAKIIENTISAKDFCLEQAPDVINQLLTWKFTVSLICFIFGVAASVGLVFLIIKTAGWFKKYDAEPNIFTMGGFIGSITLATLAALLIIDHGFVWFQIWIAPKVYLLEYASSLVR